MTGPLSAPGVVWLASRSPRRRRMLRAAGVAVIVEPPGFDDGLLCPGPVPPAWWVVALAYLKARWVADLLGHRGDDTAGTVLAADTLCVQDGVMLGQPSSVDDARAMLTRLRGAEHQTLTGVCLVARPGGARRLFVDAATVRVGTIPGRAIEEYLAGGAWRGKAGAYNLEERVQAGWDMVCEGDPSTVMGLPMRRLEPWLARWRGAVA